MPIFAGIAAAGVSTAGGFLQGAMNNSFSEEMANTAMQRRVTDLKAAGLNPMLAFSNGGMGASAPVGAYGNFAAQGVNAFQSGQQIAQNAQSIQNQNKVQSSQANLLDKQAENQGAQGDYYRAQTNELNSRTDLNKVLGPYYQGQTLQPGEASQSMQANTDWVRQRIPEIVQAMRESNSRIGLQGAQAEAARGQAADAWSNVDVHEVTAEKIRQLTPVLRALASNDLVRGQLGIPGAANKADFETSGWGQFLAKIGLSAKDVFHSAGSVAPLFME